jgi:sulfur carrier protein
MPSVIKALCLKADRIAIEQNGTIIPRTAWPTTLVSDNDRLEIVHFVGGGSPELTPQTVDYNDFAA